MYKGDKTKNLKSEVLANLWNNLCLCALVMFTT